MPALRKTNDGLRHEPTLTNEGWGTRTSEKQMPRASHPNTRNTGAYWGPRLPTPTRASSARVGGPGFGARDENEKCGGVGHGKTRTLETEGCGTRQTV